MRGYGLKRDNAALRVFVLNILEYALLAPAAFAAALWMLLNHQPAQAGVLPSWVLGVPAGAMVTLIVAVVCRRHRARGRLALGLRRWLRALGIVLTMAVTWPAGVRAWIGMAVYWAGDIAVIGVCLLIFPHRRLTTAAVVVAYATGYALTRRTLPLAGAGAVEALLPFALMWVSYPLAGAVLAVACYRVFNLWLTVPPSAAGLVRLRRSGRSARVETTRTPQLTPVS